MQHMENESEAKEAISKLEGTFVKCQKIRVEVSDQFTYIWMISKC